jgi:hypothetical protein
LNHSRQSNKLSSQIGDIDRKIKSKRYRQLAALTAQMQTAFAEQLAAQAQAHRAELQELVEECRASAHDARLAKVQLQDQREELEASTFPQ